MTKPPRILKECKRKECSNYVIISKGSKRLYCSPKCQELDYYQKKKDVYIKRSAKWQKENPEKAKATREKTIKKYFENNREEFNALMRKQYQKNKKKWASRSVVGKILSGRSYKKHPIPNPNCKVCNSSEDLLVRNTTYPVGKDAVHKAIDNGEIYYLCKKCRKKEKDGKD